MGKGNIYLLQCICALFTKNALDMINGTFGECFNFAEKCPVSIKAALGLNGNSAKVSEEKFQFCRPAILSGHQGRRRPKVLVWASRGPLPSPALHLLSPAWPGAPHGLPSSTPMSSYPQVRFPTSTSTSSSKWVGEPDNIFSYRNIPLSSLGRRAWKFAHVNIWQSAWRRKKRKCQSTT